MIHRINYPGTSDSYTLLQNAWDNCSDGDTLYIESSGNNTSYYHVSQTLNFIDKKVSVFALGTYFQPTGGQYLNPIIRIGASAGKTGNCPGWVGGHLLDGSIEFKNLLYSNIFLEQIWFDDYNNYTMPAAIRIVADTATSYNTFCVGGNGVIIDLTGGGSANFNTFIKTSIAPGFTIGTKTTLEPAFVMVGEGQMIGWLVEKCAFEASPFTMFDLGDSEIVFRDCYWECKDHPGGSYDVTIGALGTNAKITLVRPDGAAASALARNAASFPQITVVNPLGFYN